MKIYFLICESCYLVPSIIQNGKGVEKCESLGLTPTEFVVGFLAGMLFVGVQLLQRYGYVSTVIMDSSTQLDSEHFGGLLFYSDCRCGIEPKSKALLQAGSYGHSTNNSTL